MNETSSEKIIFFDGVCNLCNSFINFLIKHDRKKIFRYAPLQGETANERLPMSRVKEAGLNGPTFTSVVFLKDGVMSLQSDAVLNIIAQLGCGWSLITLFKLVPRPIRDEVYQLIAQHRYKWFGKRDTCRLPTKEEMQLFLD